MYNENYPASMPGF